jgi:hypothetical protein
LGVNAHFLVETQSRFADALPLNDGGPTVNLTVGFLAGRPRKKW